MPSHWQTDKQRHILKGISMQMGGTCRSATAVVSISMGGPCLPRTSGSIHNELCNVYAIAGNHHLSQSFIREELFWR
jgi:hypothetical protein